MLRPLLTIVRLSHISSQYLEAKYLKQPAKNKDKRKTTEDINLHIPEDPTKFQNQNRSEKPYNKQENSLEDCLITASLKKMRGEAGGMQAYAGNSLKTVMRLNTSLVTKGLAQKHLCQRPD